MTNLTSYVSLADHVFPKKLESNYLFDKKNDELYELNDTAFAFVITLDGSKKVEELNFPKNFFKSLVKHKLLSFHEQPRKRTYFLERPPYPSVRYLEIQLTLRCNLNCHHCYQGQKDSVELPLDGLKKVLEDFIKLQGIRVLLSGGEPLLYSKFLELNKALKDYPARVVLLTNGTLLERFDVDGLNVDEIQFSLDGMEKGHDYLRGKGSFERLVKGIELVKNNTNKDISFATMIHRENLKEFKKMKEFVKSYEAKEWGIDFPVIAGNLKENSDFLVSEEEAIKVMKHRFGASFHDTGSYDAYACGVHLLTLNPKGEFLPCSFYPDKVLGTLEDGLLHAIGNRKLLTKETLTACKDCEDFSLCHGGCRFRAGDERNRDILMCKLFGKN